jgi:hypothetical protein
LPDKFVVSDIYSNSAAFSKKIAAKRQSGKFDDSNFPLCD